MISGRFEVKKGVDFFAGGGELAINISFIEFWVIYYISDYVLIHLRWIFEKIVGISLWYACRGHCSFVTLSHLLQLQINAEWTKTNLLYLSPSPHRFLTLYQRYWVTHSVFHIFLSSGSFFVIGHIVTQKSFFVRNRSFPCPSFKIQNPVGGWPVHNPSRNSWATHCFVSTLAYVVFRSVGCQMEEVAPLMPDNNILDSRDTSC